MDIDTVYALTFKIVYTEHTKKYFISSEWTIREFVEIILVKFKHEFPVLENYDIEIISSLGQTNNAEEGVKINPHLNIKIRDIYSQYQIKNLCFYIRPKELFNFLKTNRKLPTEQENTEIMREINNNYSLLLNGNREELVVVIGSREETGSDENHHTNICSVCLNIPLLSQRRRISNCIHSICVTCYQNCLRTNNVRCPVCRIGNIV